MATLRSYQMVRPGVGVVIGRRGGFFKKLFKGVVKVAKFVAPAVVAVAKTAAKHTVVGQIVTAVGKVKKSTAFGAASKAMKRTTSRGDGAEAPKRRAPRRAKAKKRGKAKRGAKGITAKQRAARARFAKAAKKGRIKKGQRL